MSDPTGDRHRPDRLAVDGMSEPRSPDEAGGDAPNTSDGTPSAEQARQNRGAAVSTRWGSAGLPTEKSSDTGTTVRRLLSEMHTERLGAIGVIVLAVISVALYVLGPRILGEATDTIVEGVFTGGIDFDRLAKILIFVSILYLSSAVLSYWQAWLLTGVVQRTMMRLRDQVEEKINHLPLSYVDRQPRGDLLSRVTNDLDNLGQSLQQTLSQMLTSLLTIIGVLAMMFWIAWPLALIAAITIPLSLWLTRTIAKRSKLKFLAQWTHTGDLNAQVDEAFTGHALVKVFGRQADVEAAFRKKNDELYDASYKAQFISGIIQPMMMFLGNLNFVAIAVIGGLRVASGAMSIGDIQAFIQYTRQFTQPLTQLASMFNVLQSGIASAERVFETLDAEEESADPTDAELLDAPRGRVVFDDIDFSYEPAKPLIEGLDLVAEPGQTVAIVGPTGAGKTTLVNLLMRFYDLDGGAITLDGTDIAAMTRHELRSKMGMVLQDTWLFSGTIRDNIAYGNLDATDDEILTAARAAYVDRFVHHMPNGYDSLIEGEGGNLSAGEKQLLTIARAFLSDPAILILDEATSSVDTRTEVLIQEAMAALRSNRTSFVIAHRLSTIRDADTILVMKDGSIVEQGNHDELVEAGGAYDDLYQAQFAAPAVEVA